MTDYRELCVNNEALGVTEKLGIHDEKSTFSTKDVYKSAKVLCKALAEADGVSNGNVISRSIWKEASERFHPSTIKLILSENGIDFDIK